MSKTKRLIALLLMLLPITAISFAASTIVYASDSGVSGSGAESHGPN